MTTRPRDFEVGDRVRITGDGAGPLWNGRCGTVTAHEPGRPYPWCVQIDPTTDLTSGASILFAANELELVIS